MKTGEAVLIIRSCALAALLATSCLILPVQADQAAEAVLHAASVWARDAALTAMESDAPATHYAGGAARFFIALEGLATDLNRHGFDSPQSLMLPLLRLPVAPRADPEPLTYDGFRAIIGAFRDRMAAAAQALAQVPDEVEIALDVDLALLGIDLNGDGAISADESVAAIMAGFILAGGPALPGGPAANPAIATGDLVFRFDRADGYWLQGYANFLVAQADFWLAHDFRAAFDNSFHMLFPQSRLPLQEALVPPRDRAPANMVEAEWRIVDFVSFIHLINWPVAEPERREAVRASLLEMIRLSRENWKSIRAETDNEREWLPGPHQPGIHLLTGLEVGEEQVVAWHEALRVAEDLLEGRRLLPHFRISGKGINMKRFFDEPKTFDLILAITGPGIAPYLEEGDILTAEEWSVIMRQFGDQGFLPFAIWFN